MICINWDGFPQYGARCVGALVKAVKDERVVVVAMRPDVPIAGMEELAGCPVIWVDRNERRSIREICGEMPRYISVSGWSSPLYNRWRDEVRAAGGRASCGCDNNYALDLKNFSLRKIKLLIREVLNSLRFRLKARRKYDAFFVPGKSGRKLLRFYGVEDQAIFEGAYAADASLFHDGEILTQRALKMIYVGRINERKNVLRLVVAFADAVHKVEKPWRLDLYGCGPLTDVVKERIGALNDGIGSFGAKIELHDFIQPEQLAARFREARLFCLPSLTEHWGLVVHEAALSGCVLLLADGIGAADDLLAGEGNRLTGDGICQFDNGYTFDPYSVQRMSSAIQHAMKMTDEELLCAQKKTCELAKSVNINRFVDSVKKMADGVGSVD